MKYRTDFVTNSSSTSYTCEICGRTETGFNMGLDEAEMVECVNGHTICEEEMLPLTKEQLIKAILNAASDDEGLTETVLEHMSDDELTMKFMRMDDVRYQVPEEFCPICQFIEYSEYDLARYLERAYGVSRDEVFAQVKQVNKRRKKLYEGEYITFVCQKYSLDPTEIVAEWKARFGTYSKFYRYITGAQA